MSFLANGIVLRVLQSQTSAISMPLLHYLLIQLNISTMLSCLPVLVWIAIIPLLRVDPLVPLHPMVTCTWTFMFLRIADAALLPKAILYKMTFMEYVAYIGAFKLPAVPAGKDDNGKKAKNLTTEKKKISAIDASTIPYKALLSTQYARNVIVSLGLKALFFYCAIEHLRHARAGWRPVAFTINDFSDWTLARDYLLLGFAVMFILDISATVANHCFALIFQAPYVPIMNAPYLATSIRDFWVRWNLIIQRGLRRVAFDPVVYAFGYGAESGKRIPPHIMAVAGLWTFIFSGLMHEWMMYQMINGPSTYEQLAFFTINGFLALGETFVDKFLKGTFGIDCGKIVPWPLQILYTMILGLIFNPLFNNPFINNDIFFKLLTIPPIF